MAVTRSQSWNNIEHSTTTKKTRADSAPANFSTAKSASKRGIAKRKKPSPLGLAKQSPSTKVVSEPRHPTVPEMCSGEFAKFEKLTRRFAKEIPEQSRDAELSPLEKWHFVLERDAAVWTGEGIEFSRSFRLVITHRRSDGTIRK